MAQPLPAPPEVSRLRLLSAAYGGGGFAPAFPLHPPSPRKNPPRCFHTGAGSIIMNYRSTSACNFFSAPLSPVL